VFGLPVVATDTPGMREILSDGETGLIVPVENVQALVDALVKMVGDRDLRSRLGAAFQKTVERHFTLRRYVTEMEDAYSSLLERPRDEYGWNGPRTGLRPYRQWLGEAFRQFIRRNRGGVDRSGVSAAFG
jgi:hypothetical protein